MELITIEFNGKEPIYEMASGKNIQPYTYIEITTTTNADGYALIAHGGYIPNGTAVFQKK